MAQTPPRRQPEDLLEDCASHADADPPRAEPRREPADATVRVRPLVQLFLWGVGLVLFLRFFESVTFVAMMLLLAGAVASLMAPVARRLPGPRWLRGTIAGAAFLLALVAGLTGLGWLVSGVVGSQIEQWPQIRDSINSSLTRVSEAVGLPQTITVEQVRDQAIGWLTSGEGDLITQAMSSLGGVLVGLLLLAFGSIYFLAEPRCDVVGGVNRLLPGRGQAVGGAIADLTRELRGWLVGTLVSVTVTALASVIGYWLVGLEYAVTLGLFAGFAEFIPVFGPAAAFLVALLVASTQGTTEVIGVAVVYLVVQSLESYILLPLIMKRAVHLPPLITLFSIVLWGRLLGPLGLVLAIPIDLTIWTLVDHFWIRPRERRRELEAGPPQATEPDTDPPPGGRPPRALRSVGTT